MWMLKGWEIIQFSILPKHCLLIRPALKVGLFNDILGVWKVNVKATSYKEICTLVDFSGSNGMKWYSHLEYDIHLKLS